MMNNVDLARRCLGLIGDVPTLPACDASRLRVRRAAFARRADARASARRPRCEFRVMKLAAAGDERVAASDDRHRR
jgi:hypothetical protein